MNDPYVLAFSCAPGMTPTRYKQILASFGSMRTAWHTNKAKLFREAGFSREWYTSFQSFRSTFEIERTYRALHRSGVAILDITDQSYPSYLANIHNAPAWLYVRGKIPTQLLVAVVGTRQMSDYAKRATQELVRGLVESGIGIVSGLAFGVDKVAHETALESGGLTIGVLGSGLNRIIPSQHERLAHQIIATGGALVSEYPLNTDAMPYHFPMRNRIISGLSRATIVIAAGERSGALITARYALEQGRDVFAVPGSIFSETARGCHQLIREGAILADHIEVIRAELGITKSSHSQHTYSSLLPEEVSILSLLSDEPVHFDELVRKSGMTPAKLAGVITLLESKGAVVPYAGMRYVRV